MRALIRALLSNMTKARVSIEPPPIFPTGAATASDAIVVSFTQSSWKLALQLAVPVAVSESSLPVACVGHPTTGTNRRTNNRTQVFMVQPPRNLRAVYWRPTRARRALSGDNGQTLNLTGAISAGTYGSPVLTVIEETDLASFLNPIPGNITVSGTASFGDGITSGTVTSNDFVFSRVAIESPLEIIIGESSFEGDITEQEIDQTDMESITDHIIEANFISTIIKVAT